jgi:hypothetical protein
MATNIWQQALERAKEEDAAAAAEEEKQRLAEEEEKKAKKKKDEEDEEDEQPARRRRRRVSVRRKRRRYSSSGGSDSDLDDATIVKTGKAIAGVKNMGVVYPMLSKRTQTAVRTGVRKMAKGDYDDTLRSNERKSIRKKYRSVYKKGKNPFTKQYAKVGKTYSRFMREVSLKEASSSDSSDSSGSTSDSSVE